MRIGVFGGTFDPPHIGHSLLADESLFQLQLNKILWVLTPNPPHKINRKLSPPEQRLSLVQAAITNRQEFILSRVDLNRRGPHYALDTVQLLQKQFPGDELFYLIGGDSFHDLPIWYKPDDLIRACAGIGVMRRPGDEIDIDPMHEKLPGLIGKTYFIDTPLLDISSTDIRQRIAHGRSYQYYLLPPVYDLIEKNRYYHPSIEI
jgi:nicotinate-nucleotide adenylyltransferase